MGMDYYGNGGIDTSGRDWKHPSMPAHGHAQREVVRMSKPIRLINEKSPYFLRIIRQGEAEEQADFPLHRLTFHC